MDSRLLDLLVCPVCKGPLLHEGDELVCARDRLAFAVRDGIPVMIEDQARELDAGIDPDDDA